MNKTIKILATTDVHGFIYPYSYADGSQLNAGLAKISAKIASIKDENTIVINNGDDLQGSPLAYYHYQLHHDEISPMTIALNKAGYDYNNLGNHDFNYGQQPLLTHIQNLNAPTLTGNISYQGTPLGKGYVIHEAAGKKIAIFGVTTHYIPNWEEPGHITDMSFEDAFAYAKRTVEQIRTEEHVDYVVGVYHGGLERDPETGEPTEEMTGENQGYQMMKEIDGLDILITGHQHRLLAGELFGTVYTQTPSNGTNIAYIEIDTEKGTITPSILELDEAVDTDMLALVQQEEDACQIWLDQPLGTSNIDLRITDEDEARFHKSQVITFLNQILHDESGAQICANAIFKGAQGFQSTITMRNLVSTYPFPNTLVVKKVNGKVLREYLEKDAEYWTVVDGQPAVNPKYKYPKPMEYNYDMLDGISYTIKAGNPVGQRIVSLKYEGQEITDDQEFTLCINNYRASGGGDYAMLKDTETLRAIDKSVVEVIAKWLEENHVIDFTPVHNIEVIA